LLWNVSQLLKSPIGTERGYPLDDDSGIKELAAKVTGEVRMIRTDRGVLVMAQVRTAVRCECVRCLEQYAQPVSFTVEEEFFPTIDINTGVRLEIPEDGYTIDQGHVLDFTEPVREYALLSLPMKTLCTLNCPGLCATCGASLKAGPCGCDTRPADPRWNQLEALRSGLGGAN
jgi:uncharacterized protein